MPIQTLKNDIYRYMMSRDESWFGIEYLKLVFSEWSIGSVVMALHEMHNKGILDRRMSEGSDIVWYRLKQ